MNSDPRTRAVKSQSFLFLDEQAELLKGHTSMRPVEHIYIDNPPIGFKGHLMLSRGTYVLERGPGVLQSYTCGHAGSGGYVIIDGIPDEDGFFSEPSEPGERDKWLKDPNRNGKKLVYANPPILASNQMGIGFLHGLTIQIEGLQEGDSASPILTVAWMPVRAAKQ